MIERFNFYDIYGYLLPGLILLGLVWLPFGIVLHYWPVKDISAALLLLLLAYVVGHIIQMSANLVIPSAVRKIPGGPRKYPSDSMLDNDDGTLSSDTKEKIRNLSRDKLGLDIAAPNAESDRRRRDAFFYARYLLAKNESQAYAEQFEGLYAMMRGAAFAFGISSPYLIAWAAVRYRNISEFHFAAGLVPAIIAIALVLSAKSLRTNSKERRETKIRLERWIAGLFLLLSFTAGFVVGRPETLSATQAGTLACLGLACSLLAVRCHGAYRFFADQFAQTVWRDFAVLNVSISDSDKAN